MSHWPISQQTISCVLTNTHKHTLHKQPDKEYSNFKLVFKICYTILIFVLYFNINGESVFLVNKPFWFWLLSETWKRVGRVELNPHHRHFANRTPCHDTSAWNINFSFVFHSHRMEDFLFGSRDLQSGKTEYPKRFPFFFWNGLIPMIYKIQNGTE